MDIRLAAAKDIRQLIQMRWDFTIEDNPGIKSESFNDFERECLSFLEKALNNGQWFIWIAEEDGKVISHIYIELVQKVPRPGRKTFPFAYMTNVYTVPEYRKKGIGSELLSYVNTWVKENNYEFVIVWPSDESINFYKKNGYVHCKEPLEFAPYGRQRQFLNTQIKRRV